MSECKSRYVVRIPDAPSDQWESYDCIQDHDPTPPYVAGVIHDDGAGTRWMEVADQGKPQPSASYISPALPGMIRNLYRDDLRPKSIQNMLDLAADLVQELIDLRADQGKPQITEDDERIDAWERVAKHPVFRQCYDEERPLIDAVMDRLTGLREMEATVNELRSTIVTDEMVLRGARALRAQTMEKDLLRADLWREDARAVLEAALGGEA